MKVGLPTKMTAQIMKGRTPSKEWKWFNPDYAIEFVERVKSATEARVSLRKNSLSYSADRRRSHGHLRKPSETLDTAAILASSRTSIA